MNIVIHAWIEIRFSRSSSMVLKLCAHSCNVVVEFKNAGNLFSLRCWKMWETLSWFWAATGLTRGCWCAKRKVARAWPILKEYFTSQLFLGIKRDPNASCIYPYAPLFNQMQCVVHACREFLVHRRTKCTFSCAQCVFFTLFSRRPHVTPLSTRETNKNNALSKVANSLYGLVLMVICHGTTGAKTQNTCVPHGVYISACLLLSTPKQPRGTLPSERNKCSRMLPSNHREPLSPLHSDLYHRRKYSR